MDSYLGQNRIDDFETTSSGYTLLRAGLGTMLKIGMQTVRVNISANNLLNKEYYDHLSRFKPGRLDQANPTFGVFNPGRNVTFGLSMPINIK